MVGGMVTLLVGVLVVIAGAVGFGIALFGSRPVPQPATASPQEHRLPETAPRPTATLLTDEIVAPLKPTGAARARAIATLLLAVLGTAALIGTLLGLVALAVSALLG